MSTLSSNKSDKDDWKKFRKISGNHIQPPRFPIIQNEKKTHDKQNISNVNRQHFEKISSGFNVDQYFQSRKTSSERNITRQNQLQGKPTGKAEMECETLFNMSS